MTGHAHTGKGSNMASTGREHLARLIAAFKATRDEKKRVDEIARSGLYGDANLFVFREHVRFVTWLEREAIDESPALDSGLRNKQISAWLLNLPNYLAARELATSYIIEKELFPSEGEEAR